MKPGVEAALRDLGIRGDIIKMMHRAVSAADREPDVAGFALHGDEASEPVSGRLVERGLHDELKGTAYAIIDGIDGRTHHVVFSDLEVSGDAKPGAIVETRAYDDAGGRKRLSLATRSDLSVEAQVAAPGATWIDRQLLTKEFARSSGGFGAEVREAMDRRIDHLVEQDLARRQGQRVIFTRDLINTLRRRELDEAASKLSAHTGLAHRLCAEGEHVSGICRQRVTLASERFVMIDDGLGFQLVTWRPALEQRLGQQVSGTLPPGGGIDWSFQRKRGLGNRHSLMKPLAHFGPFVGLSRHGRNPTPPGRSSLAWDICRTTSRCAASWLVKPAGDPDDALGVTAIQKRTPSAASFNIWALRFSAARSPASRAGMNVFTTPAAPSTRGKDSATSRTPWHSVVKMEQVISARSSPSIA